jgi:hypothetical protein
MALVAVGCITEEENLTPYCTIELWPEVSEYQKTYPTGFKSRRRLAGAGVQFVG